MKATLVTVLVVLVTILSTNSCSLPLDADWDQPEAAVQIPETIHTIDQAIYWVYCNIQYEKDTSNGHIEHWQSPAETLQLRTGDCDDKAILLAYIAYKVSNIKVKFSFQTIPGYGNHMSLIYNNKWYDPTNAVQANNILVPSNAVELFRMSFDDVMSKVGLTIF